MAETTEIIGTPLTGSQLAQIIDNFDNSQYLTNEAYFQGRNETLIEKSFDGRPDNRVPLPFARRTVYDISGYAYKPGNVVYQFTEDSPEDSVEKTEEILRFNDEPIVSGEIFQDALKKGDGAELQYFADDMPQFAQIPREQCIFVYKDSVKDELDFSIRYYTTESVNRDGRTVEVKHADVYYSDRIDFYESNEEMSSAEIDPQINAQRTTTDTTLQNYKLMRQEPHFYELVPLYPYRINSDRLGVYQPALSIIDILDNFGSDSIANSIDRFNETLMLFSKKLDESTAENIKEYNIIDDLGSKVDGHFVEFLNRQMDINSTVEGFNIFERLYYELTGTINLSDERFGTKSGIAMLYALVPFENLVSQFEMYFTRGLKHRIKLLNNILVNVYRMQPVEVNLKWTRNLPLDLASIIAQIVQLKASGIVSDETLLKMLPEFVVEDVQLELERIEEQKEKNIEMFGLNEPRETEEENEE